MIAYLILGLILFFCCYILLHWFAHAEPREVFRVLKWGLLGLLVVGIILFALSGKLGLAVAALPALLVWFARFRLILNIWRGLKGFLGASKSDAMHEKKTSGFNTVMSREEALAILGLQEGALPAEIKAAYHRLITKAHPDKGGSDYLAAKINQARDVLLHD